QRERPQDDAETVLPVPGLVARGGVAAQARQLTADALGPLAREAQPRALAVLDGQPVRHVLLDPDRHLEVGRQDLGEAFRMLRPTAVQAGPEQARRLRQRVAGALRAV